MKTQSTTFSVIIPCYNEEKYVGRILDDLARQTTPPEEVIVADSRSTDRTIETAKRFQKHLPLSIAISKTRTPGAARNAGAEHAKGNYLVFIDADMRIPPDTFERLDQAAKDQGADYMTPLFSTPGRHIVDQTAIWIINLDIRHGLSAKQHLPGIGGFMCVRRALHDSIGGFSLIPKENDIEYLERLKRQNASYKVLDDLIVGTSNRRMIQDGRLLNTLYFIPHRSFVGRHLIYPVLKKLGKEKRYGAYR
jgi:glycosyltransferase involved in cell wall biosynthesis